MAPSRWESSREAMEIYARSRARQQEESKEEEVKSPFYQFKQGFKDGTEDDKYYQELGSKFVDNTLGLIFAPFIVWGAWNICIPALFGLPPIGYVYSLALYCLFKILR